MRRFLNEGNDVKTASDMKAAIESYGGIKGCYAAVCRAQASAQTMTKHTMAGVLGLHTFSYENGSMRVWRAYDVGPGKFYSEFQLLRFGTHQGPTDLVIMKPFSKPIIEAGTYQQHISRQEPSLSMGHHKNNHTRHIQMKKASRPEEGCIKTFQSFAALQRHLDVGKNMLKSDFLKKSRIGRHSRKIDFSFISPKHTFE